MSEEHEFCSRVRCPLGGCVNHSLHAMKYPSSLGYIATDMEGKSTCAWFAIADITDDCEDENHV